MLKEGDIIEIPLPDGRIAIGWILFVSQTVKNLVGFVVFGIKGVLRKDYNEEGGTLRVLGPLYTNLQALDHYGCTAFAHQPISDERRLLTKRDVGGNVYIGDECLGTVEECSEHGLKPMLVGGMPVMWRWIMEAFAKAE